MNKINNAVYEEDWPVSGFLWLLPQTSGSNKLWLSLSGKWNKSSADIQQKAEHVWLTRAFWS